MDEWLSGWVAGWLVALTDDVSFAFQMSLGTKIHYKDKCFGVK